jgi:hypothetical protein
MRISMIFSLTVLCGLAAGCGSERLETGYEPRKLGASDETRRGFYAPKFSPAAQAAERDRGPEFAPTFGRPGGRE